MKLALFVCMLMIAMPGFGSAPAGIPRDFARDRAARVGGVRYRLSFVLLRGATATEGTERISFTLTGAAQPLFLDFRDGAIHSLTVNGKTAAIHSENGHLELAAADLQRGQNSVEIRFGANIAPAGKAITRIDDRDDGSEYVYTLFVPMDASMAFPCFDQPDIKGRFRLEVTAPKDWVVVSNTPVARSSNGLPGQHVTTFQETHPISTYLFAFAAGPFRRVPGDPGLYVRKSQLDRAQAEAPEVQQIAAQGEKYLSDFFAQPFPFSKYDMVLIPGFPYGGMEHAGATFLREESVLFRTAPTRTDVLNRDILVLHELTHQWFGDLVTMRWFDDLWLKEGFAQYMAYDTLAFLKPNDNVWKQFYQQIKPPAYAIDATQGTTPIYQDIANLADAKSAYGDIVYSKTPGVLKQLTFVLGNDTFRDGLRLYLKDHAYANAEWSDLVRAFESVSHRSLQSWADSWIRRRGMPQVDVSWSCEGGAVNRLALTQQDVLGTAQLWPVATQLSLHYSDGKNVRIRADLATEKSDVRLPAGTPCPQFVFANDEDFAYGRFLLDDRSREAVIGQIASVPDLFERTLLWGSLWESVRQADLAPRTYISLATKALPGEGDFLLAQSLLSNTATALHHYTSNDTRQELIPAIEAIATEGMANADDQNMRILWFRALRSLAESPSGLTTLKSLLNGDLKIPGVELRELDRWNLVTALIAHKDPDAASIFEAEKQKDPAGDGPKYAYIAEAARPDAATKERYFDDYLHNKDRQEDWIEESLGAFNYWNQSALTQPYVGPALSALEQVKQQRKIFFLVDWLDAFLSGQQSPGSKSEVDRYVANTAIDPDLRLKILQAKDDLDRAVAIRQKFPQ